MDRAAEQALGCWNRIGVRGDASCAELKRHIHCRNCPVYSSAAARFLDRDLPEGYRSDWTGQLAKNAASRDLDTQSLVIFRLGAEWLALPTEGFEEVAEMRPIHPLPGRRGGAVLGIANVRGELLICVSLAKVLDIDETAKPKRAGMGAAHRRLLVIAPEGGRVAFPADEVNGVHSCHPKELKPVPATVAGAASTYTKAVLPLRGHSVGCLDSQLVHYALNRSIT